PDTRARRGWRRGLPHEPSRSRKRGRDADDRAPGRAAIAADVEIERLPDPEVVRKVIGRMEPSWTLPAPFGDVTDTTGSTIANGVSLVSLAGVSTLSTRTRASDVGGPETVQAYDPVVAVPLGIAAATVSHV